MAKRDVQDPLQMWREWVDGAERQWNSVLTEFMGTEQFGQASGRMMEAFLGMQASLNEATQRYFSALNLPTRTDVLSIAERLTGIEDRLSDIERRLATVASPAPAAGRRPRPKPKRTKKAPAKSTVAKSTVAKSTVAKSTAKKRAAKKRAARPR